LASLLDSLGIPAETSWPDPISLDSIKKELDEDNPVIMIDTAHATVVVDYFTDSTGNDWWIVVNGLSDNMFDTLDNIRPAPAIITEPNDNSEGNEPGGNTPSGPADTAPVGNTPITEVRPVKGKQALLVNQNLEALANVEK